MREPVERLAEVDAVLFNGAEADSAEGYAFRLQPTALVNVASGERVGLEHFRPVRRCMRWPVSVIRNVSSIPSKR